ncbi:hypothetical protein [Yinghuangia sp. YIM S09857]|uniref:hypothetical protein n=1 Tax=Yinghuangia sp. YIM S09857 TaxID=3436929 RepID=UPI003F53BECE
MGTYPSAARQAQLRVALALREFVPDDAGDPGPPVAEALVEAAAGDYPLLVDHAHESGFGLCLGEPPPTTAQVLVHRGYVVALTLVGERQTWLLPAPMDPTPAWLDAAEAHGMVVVELLPPGTWPAYGRGCPEDERVRRFNARLRLATENAAVLHGAATLIDE